MSHGLEPLARTNPEGSVRGGQGRCGAHELRCADQVNLARKDLGRHPETTGRAESRALPERLEDVPLLARHFAEELAPQGEKKKALRLVIREYTLEAGLRNLERRIADLCRKSARRVASGKHDRIRIDDSDVR